MNETKKVTVFSAYKSMFNKYASFGGRCSRREYWYCVLANMIILCIYFAVFILSGILLGNENTMGGLLISLAPLVLCLYMLAILVPSLALLVRRLHDSGKSGWLALIALVPMVGGIIILVLTVLESEPGENKYGLNPNE